MTAKRKAREITRVRRQEILDAAEKLFSEKGFKGTTTKDLAAKAGVHEAILFRYFKSKHDLYQATLELKISRNRHSALEQMQQSAKRRDDRRFFEALAIGLLTRFEEDPSITRLILYSALDRHEPIKVTTERQLRVEQPTLDYISKRMSDGAFRKMDPNHAVFAFGAMLFGYVVRQQILGMSKHKTHDRKKIAKDFVTIFLDGMLK
ncbi:MAG TPA: TetR/AcrR family transcriptional regulator [Terriglobia bacterium]|nr:TetR/AcrR family transcriptional regulator [Terriglobia bacterium]